MSTKKKKEKEYRAHPAVSNSSLGWLEVSPRHFVARINKELEDESTPSLDMGTLIHILALEPERVKEYVIIPEGLKFPSSKQQKEMCEVIIDGTLDLEEGFELLYPQYYSTKGKSDKAVKKAVADLCKELGPYIDFKVKSRDKTIIQPDVFEQASYCEMQLHEHKKASKLLFGNEEALNELEIYFKVNVELPSGNLEEIECKSKIDRLVFNHKKKEVYLIDLKTTSKIGSSFHKSVEFYDYDRQLAFYKLAVESYLQEKGLEGYTIIPYFVVVETIGFNEVYVYKVPEEVIEYGEDKYIELLDRLAFHIKHGFDYPKEYYEGDGSIPLIME